MKRFVLALCLSLATLPALAAPITYNATLTNDVAVFGEISPFATSSGTSNAQYFNFYTDGLQELSITGTRVDVGYDMALWILSGVFGNTTELGSTFGLGDAAFVVYRDDNVPAPAGGPHGDPRYTGTLNAGWYTVAVTNFASNGNTGTDGVYDFQLLASDLVSASLRAPTGVPEPAPLALLALGLAGVAFSRR